MNRQASYNLEQTIHHRAMIFFEKIDIHCFSYARFLR